VRCCAGDEGFGRSAGVDKQSIADFVVDLKNNLNKIWNRMSELLSASGVGGGDT
jgi:hypothetical protein